MPFALQLIFPLLQVVVVVLFRILLMFLKKTKSDAALVASLFHYGEVTVDEVKEELIKNRIPARIIKKEII